MRAGAAFDCTLHQLLRTTLTSAAGKKVRHLEPKLWPASTALDAVEVTSSRFFWNLAKKQISRVLLDAARHHRGPRSFAANYETNGNGHAADDAGQVLHSGRAGPPEVAARQVSVTGSSEQSAGKS